MGAKTKNQKLEFFLKFSLKFGKFRNEYLKQNSWEFLLVITIK